MRSVFLEGISNEQVALDALNAIFPDQLGPTKTVFEPNGEHPIGWLYVGKPEDPAEQLGPFLIQADCSGRQWNFDATQMVVEALRRVQECSGGLLRDYGD